MPWKDVNIFFYHENKGCCAHNNVAFSNFLKPIAPKSDNLDKYSNLNLEYDDLNVLETDGVYEFTSGFAHVYSDKLRIVDHPSTGLPNKNFKISFEFKTS